MTAAVVAAAVPSTAGSAAQLPAPGGYARIDASLVPAVTVLPATDFGVWAAITLATRPDPRSHRSVPMERLSRDELLRRACLPVTTDQRKKLVGRLRRLESAGLVWAVVDGQQVTIRHRTHTGPAITRKGQMWSPLLRRCDVEQVASGAATWTDLKAWLRWQQVVAGDRVTITGADLAETYGLPDKTVRRQSVRLQALGWLTVTAPAQRGVPVTYQVAGISPRSDRVLGAKTAAWRLQHRRKLATDTARSGTASSPAAAQPGEVVDDESSSVTFGTARRSQLAPAALGAPLTAHAGITSRTTSPLGHVSAPVESGAARGGKAGASAAQDENTSMTRARRDGRQGWDLAERQAARIVASTRWLAGTTDPAVRGQIRVTIARQLRRLPATIGVDAVTAAIAAADRGCENGAVTDHVRRIREAVAGLYADAKAAAPTGVAAPSRQVRQPSRHTDRGIEGPKPGETTSEASREEPKPPAACPRGPVVDLEWATEPLPPPPAWSAVDSGEVAVWIAKAFLTGTTTAKVPRRWHQLAALVADQVRVARADPSRPVPLGDSDQNHSTDSA